MLQWKIWQLWRWSEADLIEWSEWSLKIWTMTQSSLHTELHLTLHIAALRLKLWRSSRNESTRVLSMQLLRLWNRRLTRDWSDGPDVNLKTGWHQHDNNTTRKKTFRNSMSCAYRWPGIYKFNTESGGLWIAKSMKLWTAVVSELFDFPFDLQRRSLWKPPVQSYVRQPCSATLKAEWCTAKICIFRWI